MKNNSIVIAGLVVAVAILGYGWMQSNAIQNAATIEAKAAVEKARIENRFVPTSLVQP